MHKEFDMPEVEDILLDAFDALGYEENTNYVDVGKYYACHNPMSGDSGSKSAMVYKDEGNFKCFDVAIKLIRGGEEVEDTSLSLTEWLRASGVFGVYIKRICKYNFVKDWDVELYKEWLYEKLFGCASDQFSSFQKRRFEIMRKKFFKLYITDTDFFNSNTSIVLKEHTHKKEAKKKAELTMTETMSSRIAVKRYLNKRGLDFYDFMDPRTITFESGMQTIGIVMNYPNGFRKIRFISDMSGLRYMANTDNGKYEEFLPIVTDGKDKLILCEGELDGMSLALHKDKSFDIFAMHNCNSIPTNTTVKKSLSGYKEIVIKIDRKDFEKTKAFVVGKVKEMTNAKVICEPKTPTDDDYNDYLVRGELDTLKI